jgi:two-component system, OmpR family, sensor histidine kinase SenX3
MSVLLVVAGAVIGFVVATLVVRERHRHDVVAAPASDVTEPVSLRDVLQGHPTGVVIADRAGRVWFRNASATHLSGTHSGVLLDAAIERHLEAARSGAAGDEVVEFYGPPRLVLDVHSIPLPDGGAVAFVHDISDRRRLDQVRTDFVANISHELKTPIGALAVLAETLVGESDPATVNRVVNRMLAEADRAAHTIDDLMELSRIETGSERMVEPVRIGEVIRAAVDRVIELASHRTITVSTLAPIGEGAASMIVQGDRRQLVSAVGNLVENAVKYSDTGGSVQVRARRQGDVVEISVTDHGAGIPQRDLDRIFERFYRVDRARSRTTGGTGLGLSIVRHVASNHGGDVVVTSVEGEGSTFVLRLPVADAVRHESDIADGGRHGQEPIDRGVA